MPLTEPPIRTVADLVRRLGDVPLDRIRFRPAPGTATDGDLLRGNDRKLCELVDGVLVEKATGCYESCLAVALVARIETFAHARRLGITLCANGPLRFRPGLVRMPDISFLSWSRFPRRRLPKEQIWNLAPDLAVDVIKPGNTARELTRKRREYFVAGTELVWQMDPSTRTVRVYTTPDDFTTATATDTLDGGDVLPGFKLRVVDWLTHPGFDETDSSRA